MLSTMSFSYVDDFIAVMYEEKTNDELFAIWNVNPLKEESFADWKDRIIDETLLSQNKSEEKTLEAMERALRALGGE